MTSERINALKASFEDTVEQFKSLCNSEVKQHLKKQHAFRRAERDNSRDRCRAYEERRALGVQLDKSNLKCGKIRAEGRKIHTAHHSSLLASMPFTDKELQTIRKLEEINDQILSLGGVPSAILSSVSVLHVLFRLLF